MAPTANLFHNKYKSAITKLVEDKLDHFKNIRNEDERIKLLYPHLQSIELIVENLGKCYEDALSYKQAGNKFYLKKENWKAIKSYNMGILICPQNDSKSEEILSILIANRSACFFDEHDYESALSDINYVLNTKAYPQKSRYKLFIRKAKCYLHSNVSSDLILEAYKMAIKQLESSEMNKKDCQLRQNEVLNAIDELQHFHPSISSVTSQPKSIMRTNPIYKNANELVAFNYEPELGRFAIANENIDIGTIVVEEQAHCAVLNADYNLTNCHYCMLATNTPLPCRLCSNIVFCSVKCLNAAHYYHRHECNFFKLLIESGVSINCHMALRMVTQQPLSDSIAPLTKYNAVYSLCRNEKQRKIEDNFHYTIMAIFLLRLLKTSSYFGETCKDEIITQDEILITKLLCKNLEILEFNAHEISEMQDSASVTFNGEYGETFKSNYIGGGLYPTAALFNHSCDPSVIRYNIGSRIIVKTIKPIQKNEIIFENYGPIYTNMVREKRQAFLLQRYWFTCACQACSQDWPLFKNMKEDSFKIRCSSKQCVGGVHINEAFNKSVCSYCSSTINILPHLKALTELEILLPKAEAFFKERNYKEAINLYIKAMNAYYKHAVPPFPDWVKVQQRLRTCMVNEGNKSISN